MSCRCCGRSNPAGAQRCQACGAWLVQTAEVAGVAQAPGATGLPTDEALATRLIELMRDGRKIEAIRIYRETTGADLAAAKQACEALEAGRQWTGAAPPDADEPQLHREVLDLARSGDFLGAIKRYREATGRGLQESKEAVEALARRHGVGVPAARGCAKSAAVLIGLLLVPALCLLLAAVR